MGVIRAHYDKILTHHDGADNVLIGGGNNKSAGMALCQSHLVIEHDHAEAETAGTQKLLESEAALVRPRNKLLARGYKDCNL